MGGVTGFILHDYTIRFMKKVASWRWRKFQSEDPEPPKPSQSASEILENGLAALRKSQVPKPPGPRTIISAAEAELGLEIIPESAKDAVLGDKWKK